MCGVLVSWLVSLWLFVVSRFVRGGLGGSEVGLVLSR